MIARVLLIVSLLGCGTRDRSPTPDTAAVVETEPEVITDRDTLTPEPVDPTFQLIGTEPFWGLRINSTGLTFTTPDDTLGVRFAATRAVAAGDSLRWNSVGETGVLVEAVIVRVTCSDGMSDKDWPYRARVVIGKDRFDGCAEPRP